MTLNGFSTSAIAPNKNMKHKTLYVMLALVAAPAWSASAPADVDKLVACADVKDTQQRLECFDRRIAPLAQERAAPTAPPTPASPPAPAAAALPSPEPGSLGEEQLAPSRRPQRPDQAEPRVVHAQVASLGKAGFDFLVTLNNGQVWRHENETQGAFLKEGDAITIQKAALGSYRLTRDAGKAANWIRVTRVR